MKDSSRSKYFNSNRLPSNKGYGRSSYINSRSSCVNNVNGKSNYVNNSGLNCNSKRLKSNSDSKNKKGRASNISSGSISNFCSNKMP